MNTLNFWLFGVYPYIALTVLAAGSILRYECAPYSWRAGSSQLLRRRQLIWGSILFHTGVLIVFFGHLIGMLTPIQVFHWIGIEAGTKQVMAIVVGGIAGTVSLTGALVLLHRRLTDPRIRANTAFADLAILVLLTLQLALGLLTIPASMGHLDGSEMVKFMAWALGIFTFDPEAWTYVADVAPVFKLHIFLGLTIFLVFPFTRLVHMLSAPVYYLLRPGWQLVRSKKPLNPTA
ncbi:nitrate reductase gamma subunit [Methylomarinovum tepidoasis]|uniref:nitrate reductase (quinone) n=1 Tax=Methylomarinovum tepidoasis TaxID=2840183 RepID=A0AAU9BW84_9GAMM|nr:respiratory nitrate reductase subunit gamma [Methylomarinovum sp. IN45]BCX87673.1 nitrate reductase gamma subunit [Methylomarinovum sp. IN45]